MKTLLLDAENREISVIDVEDDLDAFYEKLNCRCIDIPVRSIGGRYFDVMCDDEGLLKEDPVVSAIGSNGVMLVGNLMFFHHDDEGNLVELSDEDISHIKKNLRVVIHEVASSAIPVASYVVANVEY